MASISSEDLKIGILLVIFIAPFIFVIRQLFIATDDLRQRQDAEDAARAAAALAKSGGASADTTSDKKKE